MNIVNVVLRACFARAGLGIAGGLALAVLGAAAPVGAVIVEGSTSARLDWAPASGPVLYYGIFVQREGETAWPTSPQNTAFGTTATVSGAYGSVIRVRVAAYDAAGNRGPFSDSSAWIEFVRANEPPAAGDGLTPIAVGLASAAGPVLDLFTPAPPFVRLAKVGLVGAPDGAPLDDARPALCDVDGDGHPELVIGHGRGSGGLVEVREDERSGFSHSAWLRVTILSYAASNGETWPACGDLDGDGRDEIVVGLGAGGGGFLQVLDDARTGFAPLSTPLGQGWLRAANGGAAVHPAMGDLDGDRRAEIAIGGGPGTQGRVQILKDAGQGFVPMAGTPLPGGFLSVGTASYRSVNGETWPALCDYDGDGRDEIVIGFGPGGGGILQLLDDARSGFVPQAGTPVPGGSLDLGWVDYARANGATFPSCGRLDGDARDELAIGLGAGGEGFFLLLDDRSARFDPLPGAPAGDGWVQLQRAPYNAAAGLSRPALAR